MAVVSIKFRISFSWFRCSHLSCIFSVSSAKQVWLMEGMEFAFSSFNLNVLELRGDICSVIFLQWIVSALLIHCWIYMKTKGLGSFRHLERLLLYGQQSCSPCSKGPCALSIIYKSLPRKMRVFQWAIADDLVPAPTAHSLVSDCFGQSLNLFLVWFSLYKASVILIPLLHPFVHI